MAYFFQFLVLAMPISLDSVKYTALDYSFKTFDQSELESYSHVKLPSYNAGKGARKILFVLDYVPSEDLRSGKLLSGHQGQLLSNVIRRVSEQVYLKKSVKFSWLACTFNAFRTAGKPKSFQQNAKLAFAKRIEFIISRYQPDVVVLLGPDPVSHFLKDQLSLTDGQKTPWFGVPVKATIRNHECTLYSTFSLNTMATGQGGESAVLGYFGRTLANAIANTHLFAIDADRVRNHKSVLIDTVKKFDKLMDSLEEVTGPVAVDTETKNLNRIANKLLTIQFSKCKDIGYFIPINHKDSPFLGDELAHIEKRLRRYFEGKNKNEYHIYTNAGFDLNVLRTQLGVRFFANDVYDILAADFIEDENKKFILGITGEYYYSLGNMSVQYGYDGYLTAEFGKKDRSTIEAHDLDEGLIRYGTLDTVVPFAIAEQQLARAKHMGHDKFKGMVHEQISDMLHTFSRMEINGNLIDVDYLFYLKTPNSPIEQELNKLQTKLLTTTAVKKANKRLMKSKGISTTGWMGEVTVDLFSLNKPEHKQLLFFDVLGLEPLMQGKSGKGKIDKNFQAHYKDVPEVAMFTNLGKAKKLRDSYVNSFIKLLGSSEDFKHDRRIRPQYNYLGVVTGRTSAKDPNLQQVPARSALGKQIKRLFIAELGHLYIKVDYRVHEVRCWGLISFDKNLAKVFQEAKDLRDEYRRKPNPTLAKRLKLEADVHVINAAYFFSVAVEKVDKELRNAVKSVVFGLIYQMAVKTLAGNLGKSLDFTKKLVSNFQKRFPRGMKWIDDVKEHARKHLFVESPLGLRRHLWGYLLPESNPNSGRVHGDMDRRAVNSPVQGMGAQFMAIGARQLDKIWWKILKTEKRDIGIKICNSVHDSLENKSPYGTFLENLGHVEYALTTAVRKEVKRRHGFDFDVDLEIDFEIGSSLSTCEGWDFSLVQLEDLVYESILFQRNELKHDISVKAAMREVFVDGWERAPKWLKDQAKNIGWTYSFAAIKRRHSERVEAEAKRLEEEKKKLEREASLKAAEEAAAKTSSGKSKHKQPARLSN